MRDLTAVKDALKNHQIELPSWAFGNSGTRFKVFGQPGVPRDPFEKADDAAQVHRYTGVAPSMAVHIPWDKVDDYDALAAHAKAARRSRIGAVNANVFQDDDYKLGSVCNPDPQVRKKALAHLLECVDIMDATGSRDLKLWFADGTNYPGQDDIAARQDRLAEALAAVYARLGRASGCCWSTSCSSRRSTPPTCPTGAPPCCTAPASAPRPRSWSTPGTTRRA